MPSREMWRLPLPFRPALPRKAEGHRNARTLSCTHDRTLQVRPLPSLRQKEITWPLKKRYLKQNFVSVS